MGWPPVQPGGDGGVDERHPVRQGTTQPAEPSGDEDIGRVHPGRELGNVGVQAGEQVRGPQGGVLAGGVVVVGEQQRTTPCGEHTLECGGVVGGEARAAGGEADVPGEADGDRVDGSFDEDRPAPPSGDEVGLLGGAEQVLTLPVQGGGACSPTWARRCRRRTAGGR